MAYTVHNFEQGDVLYADQLNEMDAQIAANEESIENSVSSDMLAEDYSANKTYSIGDYVIYNNDLYTCIYEITAPEGWNSAHWEIANLSDGISDLNRQISDVDGALTQISERGKNLLPVKDFEKTINNLNIKYHNGEITRNGTVSTDFSFRDGKLFAFTLSAGTYTFWSDNTAFNVVALFDQNDSTISIINSSTNGTFTLDDDTLVWFSIRGNQGSSYNNMLSKLQLESGSTKTTWEESSITAIDETARKEVQENTDLVNEIIIRRYIPFELGNKGIASAATNRMSLSETVALSQGVTLTAKETWLIAVYKNGAGGGILSDGWVNSYTMVENVQQTQIVVKKSDDSDLSAIYDTVDFTDCIGVTDLTPFYLKNKFILSSNVIYGKNHYKKYCSVGDSITAGYWYNGIDMVQTDETYAKIIFDNLDIDAYVNNSISSTSISTQSDYASSSDAFVNRINAIPTDTDIVTILGGTNDYGHNTPLGTIADTTDVSFYGAVNVLLTGIINRCPNARVIFITPLHRRNDTTENSVGKTLLDYVEAIKDECSIFGVQVIDGYNESGFNTLSSIITNFMPDGLHPNPDGHAMLARNIIHNF